MIFNSIANIANIGFNIVNFAKLRIMNFEDLSEKACCPYNKNHIFDKEKYIFHLNRCKDK